jgi:hypothetical protein
MIFHTSLHQHTQSFHTSLHKHRTEWNPSRVGGDGTRRHDGAFNPTHLSDRRADQNGAKKSLKEATTSRCVQASSRWTTRHPGLASVKGGSTGGKLFRARQPLAEDAKAALFLSTWPWFLLCRKWMTSLEFGDTFRVSCS